MHALLALSACLGDIGIINPMTTKARQPDASMKLCQPLVKDQGGDALPTKQLQGGIKRSIRQRGTSEQKSTAEEVIIALQPMERQCATAAQEKGASSWLATLPVKRHRFALNEGEFWDAIALSYGWPHRMTPLNCQSGDAFSVNHVLICKQDG